MLEVRTPTRKIAVLGALYFAQGLPFGFQATALPAYLRASGASLTGIGFSSALALPWMLKVLWAPLVDRFGSTRFGRRRSWIVPMQLGLLLSAVAAALLPPTGALAPLLGVVLLMNFFAATQDIAVDGLAVDMLGQRELGAANAAQVVGYKAGMLTGGGLLVWASGSLGWRGVFGGMAALIAGVLVISLLLREPSASNRAPRERRSLRQILEEMLGALRLPGAGLLLVFIGTYKLGETLIDAMFKPFLIDAGFSAPQIGLWMGTYGMAASLLGSLLGGALAGRLPLLRAVTIAAALRCLPLVGEWSLAAFGPPTELGVIGITLAEHLFGGALTTTMFAFMMSRVDRRVGATHFTLLASVEALGKSPAGWLSGPLAEHLGYARLFALGAALSVAFLALLRPLSRQGAARTGT